MAFKFHIGSRVSHFRHGSGVVTNIDPTDTHFRYNVRFDDGTKAWLDANNLSKEVKKVERKSDGV